MLNNKAILNAKSELFSNQEQYDAVHETGHCVVLAGPGSGKTKTLTTAIAHALTHEVTEPRGIACITYSNECATELEQRLARFGVNGYEHNFIGTIHSFALTQVIIPYAPCIANVVPVNFNIATERDKNIAIENAYRKVYGAIGDPLSMWKYAKNKRLREIDRNIPSWHKTAPQLAKFIETYEAELRLKNLIDFDDMPLIAFRMIKDHHWIRKALCAKFPVLFIDEYQDLGHALHELVLLLCFDGNIRLFAVGDIDQSIYGFAGANSELLIDLTKKENVRTIALRLNYRSGKKIIDASKGALGETRDYESASPSYDSEVDFYPVEGSRDIQADYIATTLIPSIIEKGFKYEDIAILYKDYHFGNTISEKLELKLIPFQRNDNQSIFKRSSKLARFIESCATWVTGGWKKSSPLFHDLANQALIIVFSSKFSEDEKNLLTFQLINFLKTSIVKSEETANSWLRRFKRELIDQWSTISRNKNTDWYTCDELILKTNPSDNKDMPLNVFSGTTNDSSRITLTTLHSSKGREFEVVILFGVSKGDLPSYREERNHSSLLEARRLFYVGVTRPKKLLCLVFERKNASPWVRDLYHAIKPLNTSK